MLNPTTQSSRENAKSIPVTRKHSHEKSLEHSRAADQLGGWIVLVSLLELEDGPRGQTSPIT